MQRILVILLLLTTLVIIYDNEQQTITVNDNKLEQILVPVKIHLVSESSGDYTTIRNKKNIERLFKQANRIWSKAGIQFYIQEIVITKLGADSIPNTLSITPAELYYHRNFDKNVINLFLVNKLDGINGVALKEINTALVADYTTVNDFRTVAHELGHLLGLEHVNYFGRLMTSGENGEYLTEEEIEIARNNAKIYQE